MDTRIMEVRLCHCLIENNGDGKKYLITELTQEKVHANLVIKLLEIDADSVDNGYEGIFWDSNHGTRDSSFIDTVLAKPASEIDKYLSDVHIYEFTNTVTTKEPEQDNSHYDKMKKDFDEFEAKVEQKLEKSDEFWDSLD